MNELTWKLEVTLSGRVVTDGLDLSDAESVRTYLLRGLPMIGGDDIEVHVLEHPWPDRIKRLQGFATECKHIHFLPGEGPENECCLCGAEHPTEKQP